MGLSVTWKRNLTYLGVTLPMLRAQRFFVLRFRLRFRNIKKSEKGFELGLRGYFGLENDITKL